MILDGRIIKEEGLKELENKINKLDRKPGLAIIQVGNNEASNIYVKNKEKVALRLNCVFNLYKYEENVKEETILSKIDELNKDDNVDGILIQMPLPDGLNEYIIQNRVLSEKDVDGLTDVNSGKLLHNKKCLVPCTPSGILKLLKYYNIEINGKHVVIVGRSNLVGKPLMSLMLNNDATVTMCHSKTNNLKEITKTADILISAVGKMHVITSDMIKKGAVVIDVGINKIDGKIYGDVEFDSIKEVCDITPVPGGVGQMTILELFNNLYSAYENKM